VFDKILLSYFLLRMSLAIYAAPFNENSNSINNNNDIITEKRQHNKTQKNYYKEPFKPKKENFDQNKVNSVLEQIHNKTEEEDDENMDKNNFNPPPKPESAGVERTITNENMQNMLNENNLNMYKVLGKAPEPNYGDNNNLDLNNFNSNYGDSKSVEDYYKKVLPSYVPQKNVNNRQYYNSGNMNTNMNYSGNNEDLLLQKLNYMINLLEEKQDERTNNVTEEVVLYSFLGIFIIFVIDSFARVGKYVR
jgi:hypothetical protein